MKLQLRLTPKLILFYTLYALLLLAVVGILAYNSGRAALESATVSALLSTSIEKEAALKQWIADRQTDLNTLITLPDLISTLDEFVSTGSSAAALHDRIVDTLKTHVGENSEFLGLLVIEPQSGKTIVTTSPGDEGQDQTDQPYFINGKKGPYVQNPYAAVPGGGSAMAVSAPFNSPDGPLLGVLVGQLNTEDMTSIITRRSGAQQTDDTFLVNTSRLVVTQPRLEPEAAILLKHIDTEAVNRCLTGSSGVILSNDYRGIPAIIVYRWLPDRQLCLINKMDQAEALAPQYAFGQTILLISGLALLVAFLIAIGLARTITRPVLALQAGAARLGSGDLSVHLPETSGDEIGMLAREFNRMAAAIAEKETQLAHEAAALEQKVKERTEALRISEDELRMLNDAGHLFNSTLDLSTIYATLYNFIVGLMDCDGLFVSSYSQDDNLIRCVYAMHEGKPLDAQELPVIPLEAEGFGTQSVVIRSGEPLLIPDLAARLRQTQAKYYVDANVVVEGEAPDDVEHSRSAIIVPLKLGDQVMGVVQVLSYRYNAYTPEHLRLLGALTTQVAAASANALLYQQTQNEIAERKQAEAALRESEDNIRKLNEDLERRVLERTAQLEAAVKELEAFSYSVSHDLRAPLRAIDGFSRMLLRDHATQLPDEGKHRLQVVRESAQHMGQLIDDLLIFSRLGRHAVQKQTVAPDELAHQVLAELSDEQENRHIDILVGNLPVCEADPVLLKQVLVNLLSNALKFTRPREVARIEVGYTHIDGKSVYFVRDNGVGFDMQYADKLFGVFQRLHRSEDFEGTGVGLAIVQRIVHRHGGRVWAEAAVDQGATFYFTLEEEPVHD